MDFWNDNTTFVTQRKWKMWIQKICQSNVKFKNNNNNKSLHEEFINEVHWNFFNI
jgi:hypothetical protein